MEKDNNEETLTKLELAKRELLGAIELFLEDRDSVTYYLLAYASHEIIRNIANSKGVNSILKDDSVNMIKEDAFEKFLSRRYGNEYKRHKKKNLDKKIEFFINSDYYETKHGGSDPDQQITIHWGTALIIMVDSIEMLKGIGEKIQIEHIAFMIWINKINPEIYGSATVKSLKCFEDVYGEIESKEDCLNFVQKIKDMGLPSYIKNLEELEKGKI